MRRPFIFVTIWLLVSLVQAAVVRLTSDEGYYWFYSNHLQWGYYDHPPAIAVLIKAGYFIFKNELGVRLLNVLMMSGSFLLFFYLLPPRSRNNKIAFLLLLSQPLLHYLSIIVFPDGPLIFFSLLFLLGYKRWLKQCDILSALLMGLSLTGMLYSKYHGVLILLFTVLSNIRLLRSKWFWTAIGLASVLAIPHIWWQIENGLPSLQYHLQQRASGLTFRFVGEYISQQIPAFGPAFLFAAVIAKSEDAFDRTLKFIVIGTLVFFLLASFRGFVHFHWTSVALFPATYLAITVFENKKRQRLCYWLTIPFLMIILVFRIHIVYSFIPLSPRDLGYYQHRDEWAMEISKLAEDKPVVFVQNFRDAGLYSFYSGKTGLALFSQSERKTQYDLWGYEDSVQGKAVLIIDKNKNPMSEEMMSGIGKKIFYRYVPLFQSYYNTQMQIEQAEIKSDSLFLSLRITNNRPLDLTFYSDSVYGQPQLFYRVINKKDEVYQIGILKRLDSSDQLDKSQQRKYLFAISLPMLQGDYWIETGFEASGLPPSVSARSRIPRYKNN